MWTWKHMHQPGSTCPPFHPPLLTVLLTRVWWVPLFLLCVSSELECQNVLAIRAVSILYSSSGKSLAQVPNVYFLKQLNLRQPYLTYMYAEKHHLAVCDGCGTDDYWCIIENTCCTFQPPLKKIIQEDLTEENIMSHMPDLSRKKQQEVRHNPGPDVSIDSTSLYL